MRKITYLLMLLFVSAISLPVAAQGGWEKKQLKKDVDFHAVSFVDKNTGWICGSKGIIARTTDGGSSWKKLDSGTNSTLRDIHFVNKGIGFAVGGGYKLVREGKAEVGTEKIAMIATGNGGDKWKSLGFRNPHRISGGEFPLNAIFMFNQKEGLMGVGLGPTHPDGDLFETSNSGQSWNKNLKTGKPIYDIDFSTRKNGIMVGSMNGFINKGKPVFYTKDGGKSWTGVSIGSGRFYMTACAFGGKKTAYMVGQGGRIYKTTDGGASWNKQDSGTSKFLWGVDFKDEKNGIACGAGGTLLITKDGGKNWKKGNTGMSADLLDVQYAGSDGSAIYIVGANGTIIYTN